MELRLEQYGVSELTSVELAATNGGNIFTDFIGFTVGMIADGWEKIGEWEFVLLEGLALGAGCKYLAELFDGFAN